MNKIVYILLFLISIKYTYISFFNLMDGSQLEIFNIYLHTYFNLLPLAFGLLVAIAAIGCTLKKDFFAKLIIILLYIEVLYLFFSLVNAFLQNIYFPVIIIIFTIMVTDLLLIQYMKKSWIQTSTK